MLELNPLNQQSHANPEYHYIGDSIQPPSEVRPSNHAASSIGISPFPAREDHSHGIEPDLIDYSMWEVGSGSDADVDPGAGFRVMEFVSGSSYKMAVSKTDYYGNEKTLTWVAVGDKFLGYVVADPIVNWGRWTITAITVNSTWVQITATLNSSNGSSVPGDLTIIRFHMQ